MEYEPLSWAAPANAMLFGKIARGIFLDFERPTFQGLCVAWGRVFKIQENQGW